MIGIKKLNMIGLTLMIVLSLVFCQNSLNFNPSASDLQLLSNMNSIKAYLDSLNPKPANTPTTTQSSTLNTQTKNTQPNNNSNNNNKN
jgi:hypothetical protein